MEQVEQIVKKKAPLILSSRFPANNPEAGKPTHFRRKIESGQKKHTIRENRDWWRLKAEKINSGEMALHLRSWSGKPYDSKQVEWGVYDKIGVQDVLIKYSSKEGYVAALVDGVHVSPDKLASNDGLTMEQFTNWFFPHTDEDQEFEGIIIHFTDLRY